MNLKKISASLKKPLSYKEQLEKLINDKNVLVKNEEESEALEYLKSVNYYFISGYLLPYKYKKDDGTEAYSEIEFKKIKEMIEFDYGLKEILMPIISKIEKSIKTNIAYYFAHNYRYGNIAYIDFMAFKDPKLSKKDTKNIKIKKNHDRLLKEIENMKYNNKNLAFVKHHLKEYGGNIPIWAIIELFTFGNLCKFYSMLNNSTQKSIAISFEIKSKILFEKWLEELRRFRNLIAHDQRLYNLRIQTPPKHKFYNK
ncbi:Abi family protein [Streptobacillus felis]|uniref:Abi family protein n=1 Tax=Streptobacillus felis TaxID=1384509 RepID=UPI00082F22E2|nr:Abi family protein [Streptobacillus felis]